MPTTCDEHPMDHVREGTRCADPDHNAAIARRLEARARGGTWFPIVAGKDAGGDRDFLDGQAIHCGRGLLLQCVGYASDDYGEFTTYLAEGVNVRYERDHRGVTLHGDVGGHTFTAKLEPWMRFRWPEVRRG